MDRVLYDDYPGLAYDQCEMASLARTLFNWRKMSALVLSSEYTHLGIQCPVGEDLIVCFYWRDFERLFQSDIQYDRTINMQCKM